MIQVPLVASKIVIWKDYSHHAICLVKSDKYWTLPGGKCESREHPMYTLKREVKEELGISLSNFTFDGDESVYVSAIDDELGLHRIALYFAVPTSKFIHFIPGHEISEWAWVNLDDVRKFSPFWDDILRSLGPSIYHIFNSTKEERV
jgi:8-oxo-dGTP pyrophosphatase MutT (NUDIX family)